MSTALGIFFGFMMIAGLVVASVLIVRSDVESAVFRAKYGPLVEGLRTESSIVGKLWTVIVYIRWTLTIGILVALRDYNQL